MEEKNSTENQTELEKIKPAHCTLTLGGRKRELRFNFSAWAVLQEEYGGLNHFDKLEADMTSKPFTTLPHLIWIALSDREGLTEDHVLDEYGLGDVNMLTEILQTAMQSSLPDGDKKKSKRKP